MSVSFQNAFAIYFTIWPRSWMQYWIMEKPIVLLAAWGMVVLCPSLSKSFVPYMKLWQRKLHGIMVGKLHIQLGGIMMTSMNIFGHLLALIWPGQ
uniref:Callose synthase 10 n=1 Tax=Rhizophora mucronata TaxID=61149 RepID=A0A2P2MBJ3_RHIMU